MSPNPYEKLKKKTQDKIDKAMKGLADAEKDLLAAQKEIEEQEKKQKKEPKKYDAKKHQAAKKNEVLLEGDCKRIKREIRLLTEQLKDFSDGFENEKERQKNEKNVKEHAKAVFFEVEKFALKVGDSTRKLKTAFDQCHTLHETKHDALVDANYALSQLNAETQKVEFKKAQEKVEKLSGECVLIKKKLDVLQERYEYYEEKKQELKKMLEDKKIDDKEYKYYKEALKRELK